MFMALAITADTVRIVAGVGCVALIALVILRHKSKSKKKEEDEDF